MDYDDPKVEERWCEEQRAEVVAYLERERLEHGRVGEWPAWHLAPLVSIWAIESEAESGKIGWWAISGDLPCDYVPAQAINHPREALKAFVIRWSDAARLMSRGEAVPGLVIGPADESRSLASMLASRAESLEAMVRDSTLWPEA